MRGHERTVLPLGPRRWRRLSAEVDQPRLGRRDSLTILGNVRTAIARDGKLSLIETVLPDGAPPHPGMVLDVETLVHTAGRERTAAEYSNLLSQAAFRLNRVMPTAGPAAIVDAVLMAP